MSTATSIGQNGDELLLVPVRDVVLFPGVVVPLTAGRPETEAALQEAARASRAIAVVLQRDPKVDAPGLSDLHPIGAEGRLLRYVTGRDGVHHGIVQGVGRIRLLDTVDGMEPRTVRVERIAEPGTSGTDIDARFHQLRERALETLRLLEQVPPELIAAVQSVEQPGQLADMVASLLDLAPAEKQEILETVPLLARLDRVLWRLAYRLEVLRLSADIGKRTRETMEGRQREFMLREQLKAIQKELGEDEGGSPELADLRRALDEAGLPEEVDKQARRELRRLERMPEGGPESGMVRTYLEWLSELPWKVGDDPGIDVAERAPSARPGPSRAGENQAPHPRVPGRAQAQPGWAGARSSASSGRPASARPRSASRSRAPSIARSCGSALAACMTRARSAAIAAPISGRCPATSSRRSAGPARALA